MEHLNEIQKETTKQAPKKKKPRLIHVILRYNVNSSVIDCNTNETRISYDEEKL